MGNKILNLFDFCFARGHVMYENPSHRVFKGLFQKAGNIFVHSDVGQWGLHTASKSQYMALTKLYQ